MTTILGISAFYHDSAAALLVNGDISAAAQEERFSGEKFDGGFPAASIEYCLKEAGTSLDKIDYVAYYDKPLAKFERLLETYVAFAPQGFQSFSKSIPLWMKEKLYQARTIRKGLNLKGVSKDKLLFLTHHESHAASAFFPSPFEEAAILTMDGVGEWDTTCYGVGVGNKISIHRRIRFPHSIGLLYSAFTYYCGFKVNSGEYKLMGLAPYGEPRFVELIYKHLIHLKADGSYWLDMKYFNFCQGLSMTSGLFHELFGAPPRGEDCEITQFYMDVAASIQKVTEEVVLKIATHIHSETGMKNLVLAGGVSLNCVANGKLLREGPFENIWVQPAAGDAGGSLGAALFVWHQLLGKPRSPSKSDHQKGSLLGKRFSENEIERFLIKKRATFHHHTDEKVLLEKVVQLLKADKVVGWFQGREEFGPRALGSRSILANPLSDKAQKQVNLKIKFRESFRPFAPAVLKTKAHEWFDTRESLDSPYMLFVVPVLQKRRLNVDEVKGEDLSTRLLQKRSEIPAVTHVDYSARIQTVDERHGRFHRLVEAFSAETGCPMLVNTSFNLSWDPIVHTPEDAYRTFMQSEMDALVLEDCIILKSEQPLGIGDSADTSPWMDPLTGSPITVSAAIPELFVPEENTAVITSVKDFYEETPFPNYEDLDNVRALIEKARTSQFGSLLNDQIDYQASVLEVGCGTGQLTNYLSVAHRSVLGIDMCMNSLKLAHKFKTENGLSRASFAQMNLFRPALKPEFFDTVVSLGVLHHTVDCERAFKSIGKLVKPKGYLVVGLYNAYSRWLVHYPRVALYRMTGITSGILDPHFKDLSGVDRRKAWLKDQYEHPHETCHTLDQVLKWIDTSGFEFINAIPKVDGEELGDREDLFAPRSRATAASRVLSQLSSLGDGYREGGFFIVIARKKG